MGCNGRSATAGRRICPSHMRPFTPGCTHCRRASWRRWRSRCGPAGRAASPGRARSKGARIVGMVSISQRPEEAEGRKVPGHWEGDLGIGKAGKTAMGTLWERKSRYLVPVALPDGRDSAAVCDGVIESVRDMPAGLLRSITWDQGAEMARHAALTLASDIPVFFAHAHSPWERGTNENTNGLLREYFPKGTDITGGIRYLNRVADEINDRSGAIPGFRTPAEVFAELLLDDNSGDNLSS